jgi:hypothetical protein
MKYALLLLMMIPFVSIGQIQIDTSYRDHRYEFMVMSDSKGKSHEIYHKSINDSEIVILDSSAAAMRQVIKCLLRYSEQYFKLPAKKAAKKVKSKKDDDSTISEWIKLLKSDSSANITYYDSVWKLLPNTADTVAVIIQYVDTSRQPGSGFILQDNGGDEVLPMGYNWHYDYDLHWMRGYVVGSMFKSEIYLDENKNRLNKNFVVWLTK